MRSISQSNTNWLGYEFSLYGGALPRSLCASKTECALSSLLAPQSIWSRSCFRSRWARKIIEQYFTSDLYANLHSRRGEIRDYAHCTTFLGRGRSANHGLYARLLQILFPPGKCVNRNVSSASRDLKEQEAASASPGCAF